MRPVRLHLEGFLSHADTEIDLGDATAAVLVGDNGAGKTAICEAISWALFGKRPRPGHPVNEQETVCRVTLVFEQAGHWYEVIRERSRGSNAKTTLSFVGLGGSEVDAHVPLGGAHLTETQEAIEDVLGLDYETFLGSSFIGQGLADEFTRRRPAERKELLSKVLGLERYEGLHRDAKLSEGRLAGEAAEAQRQAEELEDLLSSEGEARDGLAAAVREKDTAAAGLQEIETLLAGARGDLEELRQKTIHIKGLRDRLADAQRERTALTKDVEQLELEIRKAEQASRLATKHEADARAKALEADDLEKGTNEKAEAAANHSLQAQMALERGRAAGDRAKEAKERVETLSRTTDGATCFACRQPLTAEHRDQLISELEEDIKEAATDQQQAGTHQREQERLATGARNAGAELAAQAHRLRDEISELRRGAERSRALADRIPELTSRLDVTRNRVQEVGQRLEEFEAQVTEAATLQDQVARAAAAVDAAERDTSRQRDRLQEVGQLVARAEVALRRYDEAREALAGLQRRHVELAEKRFIDGFLAEVWSKNGIPALIIENAIPQIEDEANRELDRFTDGRFSVHLESQTATQAGDIRETLKIVVTADGVGRPLEELSGGERQVVDLGLRIGLARLLSHRAGHPIEALFIDEGFTALDAGRRQRAVEVLRGLLEEFRLVLAVTHDREFADAFPVRIEVSNDGEGSRVQILTAAEGVAA